MTDMSSLRLNYTNSERCRTALAEYEENNKSIEFIGYLDSVNAVDKYEPKRNKTKNKRHRALVVDLHQVNVGHFDEITLNHAHFSTFSSAIIQSVGNMIHFRANVKKYRVRYQGSSEERYGLVNVYMLPMTDAWLTALDAKYNRELTTHQEECLLQIRHFVMQDYSRALPYLPPLERQKAGLINVTDGYKKRTKTLQDIANKLANQVHLTEFSDYERDIIKIQATPEEEDKITNEDILNQKIKTLEMQIKVLKQENKQQTDVIGAYYNRLKQKDNQINQIRDVYKRLKQEIQNKQEGD